jgi:hypothetical protein
LSEIYFSSWKGGWTNCIIKLDAGIYSVGVLKPNLAVFVIVCRRSTRNSYYS